jgi:hypothetical protein
MKLVLSFIVSVCATTVVLGMAAIIVISCLTSPYSNARLIAHVNWKEINTIFNTRPLDKKPPPNEYAIEPSPPGPMFTYYAK